MVFSHVGTPVLCSRWRISSSAVKLRASPAPGGSIGLAGMAASPGRRSGTATTARPDCTRTMVFHVPVRGIGSRAS